MVFLLPILQLSNKTIINFFNHGMFKLILNDLTKSSLKPTLSIQNYFLQQTLCYFSQVKDK